MDFDGVQAAVLHPQAELLVDFLDAVLLETIAHASASARNGLIAMLIAGYFGRRQTFIRAATAKAVPAKDGAVPPELASGETGDTDGYLFLRAADLAASAAFFFWLALSAWACFWFVFFWFDFGDLSPITIILGSRIDSPAACNFLRRELHHARRDGVYG